MNSNNDNNLDSPLFGVDSPRGFASPADGHTELSLDLVEHLIAHPAATFFVRASGQSMREVGILDQDILIVDRSLQPAHNSIVVAVINGEFTVKRLKFVGGKIWLYAANSDLHPIIVTESHDFILWGVVTYAIHDVRSS